MGRPEISEEEVKRYQFLCEVDKIEKALRLTKAKNVSEMIRDFVDKYLEER